MGPRTAGPALPPRPQSMAAWGSTGAESHYSPAPVTSGVVVRTITPARNPIVPREGVFATGAREGRGRAPARRRGIRVAAGLRLGVVLGVVLGGGGFGPRNR